MAAVHGTGPHENHEPGVSSGYPKVHARDQALAPSSTAFSDVLAGS